VLTALGFLTIAVILFLLITSRVTAVVALIGVPVAAALVAGNTPAEVGEMIGTGIGDVAGVVTMFVFAILFFGVLRDAGMFDPVVRRILAFAGDNPVTVTVATALLGIVCHLDGAGATTFLITIPAMLPLYDALGMSRLVLATVTGLAAGTMNMVPWGGPGARAASVVGVDANELWVPLLPAQGVGLLSVLGVAYLLGRREKRRLLAERPTGPDGGAGGAARSTGSRTGTAVEQQEPVTAATDSTLVRPKLFWVNVAITVLAVAVLIAGLVPPEMVFMVALVVALVVNYPGLTEQGRRIDAHARGAVLMASTLLAAGAFLGILAETGMTTAMAESIAGAVPSGLAPLLPVLVGVFAVPMSFLFGPDPYYFGVLPVLTGVGETFGIAPADIAQASLLGEETVGFPLTPMTGSFFLLVGLSQVEIGKHIRHMAPWAWLVSLIMLVVALVTGVVPLWAA
jgi:citrate-Mg2+:H+ or citrate-Ca2+:H+ symporter, CitMHS family